MFAPLRRAATRLQARVCFRRSFHLFPHATPSFARREQLNRLAALGASYSVLEAFVEAAGGSTLDGLEGGSAAPPSLYRVALANGISELLDVFRSAVLRVEAHLLHLATPLPLLTVQHFLLEVRQRRWCCAVTSILMRAHLGDASLIPPPAHAAAVGDVAA